jgi:hypothetical protein
MKSCKHCHRNLWIKARGLCDRCWRHPEIRNDYPVYERPVDNPTVCVCDVPTVVPVGGVWAGVVVCGVCHRPPLWSLTPSA